MEQADAATADEIKQVAYELVRVEMTFVIVKFDNDNRTPKTSCQRRAQSKVNNFVTTNVTESLDEIVTL